MVIVGFGIGCGAQIRRDLVQLEKQVGRLELQLAEARKAHSRLASRFDIVSRQLNAALSEMRRQNASATGRSGRLPDAPLGSASAGKAADCPADLPPQVKRLRRGMRADAVRTRLAGIPLRTSRAITLTGAGASTRQVWSGPCFRLTIAGGRVTDIELEGFAPRPRPRRRRGRRRRR